MIVSFRDKRTREFAEGNRVKAFASIEHRAEMRLDQLDSATSLRDVDLPGNHLEALKGDRKANIASVSMTNGGYASNGRREQLGRSMLKL